MRIRSGRATLVAALLITTALVGPGALRAQEPEPAPRVFTGVVVDELTAAPLAGALVRFDGHRPATLTDAEGRFELSGFGPGPQTLEVRQFGYAELTAEVVPPRLSDVLVRIPLPPVPIALEGVTTVVDRVEAMERRIEGRRRAVAVTSQAFDQERLVRSGAATVLDFLLLQPAVHPISCATAGGMGLCMIRRGRVVRPSVYIDEAPALGGLDELATYRPDDLYRIEVYGSGQEVRAYTYWFIERLMRRPRALLPIVLR